MGGGGEVRPASHQVKAEYTLDYGLQNVLFFQIVGNSFIEDQFLSFEIYESILMVLFFFFYLTALLFEIDLVLLDRTFIGQFRVS